MASKMAAQKYDINSTYKMNSGYEIPVLGYGVRFLILPFFSTLLLRILCASIALHVLLKSLLR
jgi:hypothetical protein